MSLGQQMMFIVLIFLTACQSTSHLINEQTVQRSEVEISYRVGQGQYRFLAKSSRTDAQISSFRDGTLLETKQIQMEQYLDFALKAQRAIQNLELTSDSSDPQCRTPFEVRLLSQERESTVQGCRSQDREGLLGQVIRSGEILFYREEQKKDPPTPEVDGSDESNGAYSLEPSAPWVC